MAETVEQLPEEILEQIFLLTPKNQLKALTLVSSVFRDVIGNSAKLMDRLTLKFNDLPDILDSNRKYRNVEVIIEHGISSNLSKFIKMNALTLTSIHLRLGEVLTSELKEILAKTAKNLVEFSCTVMIVTVDCEVDSIDFECLEKLTLNVIRGGSILAFFARTALKTLKVQEPNAHSQFLSTFFKVQNCLTQITLGPLNQMDDFTGDASSSDIPTSFVELFTLNRESLTKINLSYFSIPTDLARAIAECKANEISFTQCTFTGTEKIGFKNSTATKVAFKFCDLKIAMLEVTEIGLYNMIKTFAGSEKLLIMTDFVITMGDIIEAVSKLKNLSELYIIGIGVDLDLWRIPAVRLSTKKPLRLLVKPKLSPTRMARFLARNRNLSSIQLPPYQNSGELQSEMEKKLIKNVTFLT